MKLLLMCNLIKRYEQRFKSLVQADLDIICWLDRYGRIMSVNQAVESKLGYRQEEVINSCLEFVDPPYRDQIMAIRDQLLNSKEPLITEVTVPHKLGHPVYLTVKSIPIFVEDELQEIFVVARDCTKEKLAEQHLKETHQVLKNILRYQQGMTFKFTKMGQRYVNTLCDGELLYRLGLTPNEAQGMTLVELLPPDIPSKEYVLKKLKEGAEHFLYEREMNGITFLTSLRPIKKDGEVVEIIASCVDITQLKQYEELVLKSEKLNIAGRLAAGIAHEIRNPLTALKGFVKLLRESGANPKYLDIMDAELDRIKVIVDQFVNLAKPQKVNYSPLEIKEIICHVLTLINTEAIMNNIEIGYEIEDDLPPIVGDENQLKQMFLNLLKNAIEAMPDGGKLMVKVNREHHQKGERHEEMILIQITDQGKGMSKEVIDRLGQPFFTTKEEGTGLGLLTSRKIIEDHRGLLSIKSKEGEGTTMEVRLPAKQKGVLTAYTE